MTTYEELPETTRVWIYQANRPFREQDLPRIREKLARFVDKWVSHNRQLRAHGDVYHNRFVVLMVDESQAGASGCSIDASVHFLKTLQAEYEVDLFDRMSFSFFQGDEIRTLPGEEFVRLYREGKINDRTLVFDNLIETKADLEHRWIKSLIDSWHYRMV